MDGQFEQCNTASTRSMSIADHEILSVNTSRFVHPKSVADYLCSTTAVSLHFCIEKSEPKARTLATLKTFGS